MVVFLATMSFNFKEKTNLSDEKQQRQSAVSLKEDSLWLNALNKIISPFATSLTLKDMSVSCPKTDQGFLLSDRMTRCEIGIAGFNDKVFKKLSLRPSDSASLKYRYKDKDGTSDEEFWPDKSGRKDNIELIILADEERQGKVVATITIDCINCTAHNKVEVILE